MASKEKIKIFELDIDVDAAIQSQSDLKDTLDASREALKRMKKEGNTSSQQYVELEAKVKNLSREYNAAQTQLGKMLTLQGKEIKTVKEGEAALTIINKEWSKQAKLYGANSKEADALAKKHAELKERTRDLRKGIGDTSTNIGNYSADMKEALGQTTLFGRAQGIVTDVMNIARPVYKAIRTDLSNIKKDYVAATAGSKSYSGSQKAAAIATNLSSAALRVFKLALASTGIGLIIVALGSLVAWFSKTQKGIDLVNTVMAALGAGIDVVIDRMSKLGGGIVKFLSGDFSGGIDEITSSFEGMGDEIQREINLAAELERVLQRVEKAEINLDIRRAAANSRLKELKLLTDDTTRSTEDRIASANEYMKIERDLAAEEVKNQEKKVAAMLGYAEVTDDVRETIRKIGQEGVSLDQLGLSESTVEDMKEFRDEATKLYDLQAQSFERQTEQQNKLNSLVEQQRRKEEAAAKAAIKAREDRIAAAQKATDAAIQESKTRLELFIEENERQADTLKKGLELEEQVRDKRLAILEEEKEAGKLTTTEYELEKLQIKNEFLDQQAALTEEYAQKEIEAEQERLAQRQEREELEKQRKIADLENKRAVEAENFEIQMEIEKQRLEMQRQQELAEAEKTGADKALINKKYAKIEEDINYQKESAKRQQAAATFGGIAELLGKQTVAGKAAAIAQATMNTYQGVTEVWRSPTILPEPFGTIQKVVSTGVVLGSGLSAVKKITGTNANVPRAAKGATLRGPSHAGGGVNLFDDAGNQVVNAEGDENIYVVNKRASGLINSLSYINQATGGIPLSRSTTFAAAGGMIQKGGGSNTMVNQQGIDYEAMAQSNARAMSNVKIFTAVEEINDGQGNYAQIVNGANV